MRDLPDKLFINSDYEITELLTLDGVERILLSPSKCYLNDDIVQLEEVIEEIVKRYNENPMLYQIHHQDRKDFSSEMVGQKEISSQEEMREWQKEIAENHPLPDGKQWLICNENSKYFVMTLCEEKK